jgi:hypothetical protein
MKNINSAGTTLMPCGLRINWSNVSYVEYKKEEDVYKIKFKWKYKASVRVEETFINDSEGFHIVTYFKRKNFIAINEKYLINLAKIMLIEEQEVKRGPVDYTLLRIVFVEGFELKVKTKSDYWNWWKSNHA